MHEIHLLKNLFEDLIKLAKKNKIKKIKRVKIKIGEFSEINDQILRDFFEHFSKRTICDGAKLLVEKSKKRELKLVSFEGD